MSIVNGKFALKAAFRSTTFLLTPSSFPTPSTYSIARPASFHTHLGRFPTPLAHPLARQAHFSSLGSLTFLMRTFKDKIAIGNGEKPTQGNSKDTTDATKVPLSSFQRLTLLEKVSLIQQI